MKVTGVEMVGPFLEFHNLDTEVNQLIKNLEYGYDYVDVDYHVCGETVDCHAQYTAMIKYGDK